MSDARRILNFLSRNRRRISPLLILTHDYPDPDSLASAFAIQHLAQKNYGIRCRIAYGGVIGRMENRETVRILKIPVSKLRPSDFKRHLHVALIDTQPGFGNNSFPKERRATLVIDQHRSVSPPNADLAVIDPDCGATSVILARALLLEGMPIPKNLATALAYGILSDTLNLYRVSHSEVIATYLKVLAFCDMKDLSRILNPDREKRFFVTLMQGIQNSVMADQLLVSHLGPVDHPDLVSQIADFLLTYRGARWSFCTGRHRGRLRVSLRTDIAQAEAGEILRDIFPNRKEAGGHKSIAGGSFKVANAGNAGAWDEAEKEISRLLYKRLRPVKTGRKTPFHPVFREKITEGAHT